MTDLYSDYQNLKERSGSDCYNALLVCNKGNHYLAKSEKGTPVFLLWQKDISLYQPDILFKYFNVQFNIQCKVTHNGLLIDGVFCLIKFDEDYSDFFSVFIRSISASLLGFSKKLSIADIHSYIIQLGELFRFSNRPSVQEIIGLWAELYTISLSEDPILAMKFWRADKYARFDFKSEDKVFEIKATLKKMRNHEFSLEQLMAPNNFSGFVISFLLQKDSNGIGIIELAERIDSYLLAYNELKCKLWENIIQVLGGDFEPALDMYFDERYARDNAYVFALDRIPRPHIFDHQKITSVRFNVDINGIEYVKLEKLLSSLF